MMISYRLPYPPTVNTLFANAKHGGRFKTEDYKKWQKAAGEQILAQGRKRVRGPVSLSIYVVKPDGRRRDVSNLIKAVEDILVEMQIIEDDCLVQRIAIEWADAGSFECMVVVQEFLEAMAA
jgi:crossover junction endodeoxyribonuclease RusA